MFVTAWLTQDARRTHAKQMNKKRSFIPAKVNDILDDKKHRLEKNSNSNDAKKLLREDTVSPAVISSTSGWPLAAAAVRCRGPLCCGTDNSHLSPRCSGFFRGIRGSVCTALARKLTTHLVHNLPHYLIFELGSQGT